LAVRCYPADSPIGYPPPKADQQEGIPKGTVDTYRKTLREQSGKRTKKVKVSWRTTAVAQLTEATA
jgi:hypothetical protein